MTSWDENGLFFFAALSNVAYHRDISVDLLNAMANQRCLNV